MLPEGGGLAEWRARDSPVGVLFEISIVCLFFVPWFACFLVGGLVLSGGFVFWLWLLLCAVLCGVVCGGGCGWVLFFLVWLWGLKPLESFFVESLILAQDERWRRA